MEKLDKPTEDIEEYYKKTVKYAEETSDSKLQVKIDLEFLPFTPCKPEVFIFFPSVKNFESSS